MTKTTKAPFNKEQIKNLKAYQRSGFFHPFTCRGEGCEQQGVLIPKTEGMVCPCGEYTQNWVHEFMCKKQNTGLRELSIPLLGNCKLVFTLKTRVTLQNYLKPWLGVGFYPKTQKIKE